MGRSAGIAPKDYEIAGLIAGMVDLRDGYSRSDLVAQATAAYNTLLAEHPEFKETGFGVKRYIDLIIKCLGGKYADHADRVRDALFGPDVAIARLQARIARLERERARIGRLKRLRGKKKEEVEEDGGEPAAKRVRRERAAKRAGRDAVSK